MPIELGVGSKHELSWNIVGFYGMNTQWFHIELFIILRLGGELLLNYNM
jgi:hypothetical protein